MLKYFHLGRRSYFPWIFIFGVVVLFLAGAQVFDNKRSAEFLQPKNAFELFVAVVGTAAAFVHFLYAQHHQGTQMFVSLFDKFNARYNDLNEKLNAIVKREVGTKLLPEHIDTLNDYFNLCAEEHLFYEAGYLDEKVWCAWLCGMKYFARDSAVLQLWKKEIATGSYYHFKLSLLDSAKCPDVEE